MKRNFWITLLIVATSFAFFLRPFAQAVAVELAYLESKISAELMAEFKEMDTSEVTKVYIEMTDVDHEAVLVEFERRYPDEYNTYIAATTGEVGGETSEDEEQLLQRAIQSKREVYRQFYTVSNSSILEDSVDSEYQVYVSEYAPIAIIETNMETAMELAACEGVVSMTEFVEYVEETSDIGEGYQDLSSYEIVSYVDLSNQISRADILRDTYNLSGNGVKIGILETGGVPDVENEYLQNASITIRSGDEGSSVHATTIALILAAVGLDGTEHGLVPDAQFYCANINGSTGTDIYSDVEWMITNGVNVITASFGYPLITGYYDEKSQWIDHIAAVHDVHFVKSAGNNGNYVTSPGMAYNAITVGGFYANWSDEVTGFTTYNASSYMEKGTDRPEKPNLVANVYFGDYINSRGNYSEFAGTSFAAPQVAGVIAQLCCWDGNLKFRQSVMGAVLAASAAEKVDAVGNGYKGDFFVSSIAGSEQISNKEGAGILDARWSWGVLTKGNYWHLKLTSDDFPYERTITIDTNIDTVSRVAIFWTKNNTNIDHTTNVLGSNNPSLTNLDLYVYDSEGNLVASSTTLYSNFEIVQFVPIAPGTYTVKITGTTDVIEYIGLALW